MVTRGTATVISSLVLNKWVLLAITGLIIYLMGGFDIITDNPSLVVFAGLILLVMMFTGGRKNG